MMKQVWAAAGLALVLGACQDGGNYSAKHLSPIPPQTLSMMAQKGMSRADPILIRSYKKESEVEIWKRSSADGKYALLKTFPICRWSGQLGPKIKEGDRQAPEGFYTITPAQMNPNSSFYLSFDTGYPNAFDRAHGRTGSHLMVHGSCSSRGCFAMTDEAIAEVYAIARESFSGGQRNFQFQSYPFRMTAENLAKHRADPHMPFWRNLKEGSDYFETIREEPKVAVCGRRYVFGANVSESNCEPEVPAAVAEKRRDDERQVADLVAKGVAAIKVVYEDGGGHASFHRTMMAAAGGERDGSFAVLDARPRRNLGEVSREDALAAGPREILLDASGKPKADLPATALAMAPTSAGPRPSEPRRDEKSASVVARAEPARAQPEPTAPAPVQAAAGESRSVYQRMLGFVGVGAAPKPAPEPVAITQSAEPPRRPAGKPEAGKSEAGKSEAGKARPEAAKPVPSEKRAATAAAPRG